MTFRAGRGRVMGVSRRRGWFFLGAMTRYAMRRSVIPNSSPWIHPSDEIRIVNTAFQTHTPPKPLDEEPIKPLY
jgi:hypothetical protein